MLKRVLGLMYHENIKIKNIDFVKYKCKCGCGNYKIGKILSTITNETKIRICKGCGSFMNGTCIKKDDTKCVICVDCNKDWDCMCYYCGDIINMRNGKFGINLLNEIRFVYASCCKNCGLLYNLL